MYYFSSFWFQGQELCNWVRTDCLVPFLQGSHSSLTYAIWVCRTTTCLAVFLARCQHGPWWSPLILISTSFVAIFQTRCPSWSCCLGLVWHRTSSALSPPSSAMLLQLRFEVHFIENLFRFWKGLKSAYSQFRTVSRDVAPNIS